MKSAGNTTSQLSAAQSSLSNVLRRKAKAARQSYDKKNEKQKRRIYWMVYTLFFLVIGLCVFGPLFASGKGFINSIDGLSQQYSNFVSKGLLLREVAYGFLDGEGLSFPLYSLYQGYSGIFLRNTKASGVIPQIAVIMGPCAGGACYSPAICDFVFMVESTSQMFITGPQVVKTVTREETTFEELGGADVHASISGVAHFTYPDDTSCLKAVRRLVSYLPQNNSENPAVIDSVPRDESHMLQSIVPQDQRRTYDVRKVIDTFVDEDSFMEIHKRFATNLVVGFARMSGQVIGIVANQVNKLAGSLDVDASNKAARFIRCCDSFNIPIITLVDVPAFLPGVQQEHRGIIRHGAKLLYAYAEATVPKVTLIMRKAYGGAYIAMNSKGMGADLVYAWPIAELAVMGEEGAVDIMYRSRLAKSENPDEERQMLVDEYREKFITPYISAANGYIDEVILPEETREKLFSALEVLRNKKKEQPFRKHGNIPL